MRYVWLKVSVFVIFLNIIFVPQYCKISSEGNNIFKVFLNNEFVGTVGKQTDVDELLIEARREVASDMNALMFVEASVNVEGSEVLFGETDSEKTVKANMVKKLEENGIEEFYITGADATACVKSTCFNMTKAGYTVHVISDCVTSYDLKKMPEMLAYYADKGCEVRTLAEYQRGEL